MNTAVAKNAFRLGIERLLESIALEIEFEQGPYEEGRKRPQLEHGTRKTFFDRFLTLLGWSLGPDGDVAEEARIKAETIRFIDYVGIKDDTHAPVLILEAKAWSKSFVLPRRARAAGTARQLIMEAIKHVNDGKTKATSPVIGDWHDYLDQVRDYVQTSHAQYNHPVPRAVLASGQWVVIFTDPVRTFVDKDVDEEDFRSFSKDEFVTRADEIFDLLARERLSATTPPVIRPSQIPHYVDKDAVEAAYHALLVSYKGKGASVFIQTPQVVAYPVVILQRSGGALLAVTDAHQSADMNLDRDSDDISDRLLTTHLDTVSQRAAALLVECGSELGMPLPVFSLTDFLGFDSVVHANPRGSSKSGEAEADVDRYVRVLNKTADEWIIATGDKPHYLLERPEIDCRFHAWADCRTAGKETGQNAITSPVTAPPRAFFVDGSPYHCAHQTVMDRRHKRCHIAPLDERTCCSACTLHSVCWDDAAKAKLPCGQA